MSSNPIQLDTRQPQRIDWAQWLPAAEVATRLDINRSALARRCAGELSRSGMAIFVKPPSGGKVQWFIARRFDARLAVGMESSSAGASISQHLAQLPENKRSQAQQRAACVHELRRWRTEQSGKQGDWMPRLLAELAKRFPAVSPAQRTLLRWDRDYKTEGDLLKLVDTRGGDQRSGVSPDAWAEFERRWLDERQPAIAKVHREVALLAKEMVPPWHWCTLATCRRMVSDRISPERQALHRDPARYRMLYEPKIAQDVERYKAGRCWVGDHSTLDFWCRWGEKIIRPTLTLWQDWRTRKWVGYALTQGPSADTILAALRVALMDDRNMGGPTEVLVDNGKDYDSWTLQGQTKSERFKARVTRGKVETDTPAFNGIFGMLNIKVGHSLAYNPNGKARIERTFRTIHEDFDKSFATYCGRNAEHRPEYLNDLIRKQPHKVPTAENVIARLENWITAYNARAEHEMDDLSIDGRKVSPDDALAAWCTSPLLRDVDHVLDMMLLRWDKPVSVTQKGVTISMYGTPLSYGQFDPRLGEYKGRGKCVMVAVDPNDLKVAQVYDLQMRHICEVQQNEIGGMSGDVDHRRVRELVKSKRQYTQALKNVEANRHHEYLTAGEMMAAGMDQPPTPPAPGNIKFPPSEVAKPTSKESSSARKAAGAEHDELDTDKLAIRQAFRQRSRANITQDEAEIDDDTPRRRGFLSAFRNQTDEQEDLL